MQKRADLHVHTYYSDGTFSPEETVKEAKRLNLDAIAICDHDCADGIDEALEASKKYGVEIIPGVEFTCEKEGIEIHMLGYLIDVKRKSVSKLLNDLRERRVQRIYDMVDKLKKCNVQISPESVFSLSERGTIGRLHLAQAMYNQNLVTSVKEAFNKYIGDDAPCYVSRFNITPEETIKAILESGGVPVYAHPAVMGRDDFIPEFTKAGLRGLEVYHTDQRNSATKRYKNLADKLGLLATGGSDWHGLGKKKSPMGGVTVPYSTVEALKKEASEIRSHV